MAFAPANGNKRFDERVIGDRPGLARVRAFAHRVPELCESRYVLGDLNLKTTPVTNADWEHSVVAVPPLARRDDFSISPSENARIAKHIEAGGVTTLLYGGNANFYHIRLGEFVSVLEMLTEIAGDDTLVIPSVGPTFGVMMEQAEILREFDFPTVMILPQQGLTTPRGVTEGVRRFVDRFGRPVVLYIKNDGYITAKLAGQLAADGLLSGIKYAVVRPNTSADPLLSEMVQVIDPNLIVSGIGEQPAIVHLRDFGLGGFTSGCVCVAPRLSMEMLAAIRSENWARAEEVRQEFAPLEDLRNAINPIRVLHEALRLSGIAETGPLLPLLNNLEPEHHSAVKSACEQLLNDRARL